MMGALYGLVEMAHHRPWDVTWNNLADRCILQIHWHHVEPFISQLAQHSFRVLVMARHPLDMLISQLNWVNSCPYPDAVWIDDAALEGDHGTEIPLMGAAPTGQAFSEWACSSRAEALLSVSLEWSTVPGTVLVHYEDLVRSTSKELERVVSWVGREPERSAADVAGTFTLEMLRRMGTESRQHYWQGQPGNWRRLLPPTAARKIAERHARSFERFGYLCDPDESLTLEQAEANWRRLTEKMPS